MELVEIERLSRECDLFDDKHYRRIYKALGDCLLPLEKWKTAIDCYEQANAFMKIKEALEKKLNLSKFMAFKKSH